MSLGPDIERIRTWSVRAAERAVYVALRFDAAIALLLVEHGDCFVGFDAGSHWQSEPARPLISGRAKWKMRPAI